MNGKVTRIHKKPGEEAQVMGLAERVSLFITALHRDRAEALFAGLAEPLQTRATRFHGAMTSLDSARRQARLAHEFGVKPEAVHRTQQLVVSARQQQLRAAIVASLPAGLRKNFPQFHDVVESFPVAVRAVAGRLAKEAWR